MMQPKGMLKMIGVIKATSGKPPLLFSFTSILVLRLKCLPFLKNLFLNFSSIHNPPYVKNNIPVIAPVVDTKKPSKGLENTTILKAAPIRYLIADQKKASAADPNITEDCAVKMNIYCGFIKLVSQYLPLACMDLGTISAILQPIETARHSSICILFAVFVCR
jgi:hypothetical protein